MCKDGAVLRLLTNREADNAPFVRRRRPRKESAQSVGWIDDISDIGASVGLAQVDGQRTIGQRDCCRRCDRCTSDAQSKKLVEPALQILASARIRHARSGHGAQALQAVTHVQPAQQLLVAEAQPLQLERVVGDRVRCTRKCSVSRIESRRRYRRLRLWETHPSGRRPASGA